MKNTILQIFAACFLAAFVASPNVRGQGTIAVNNMNGSGTPFSTSFGLFFDAAGAPYTLTPINVTILGGPDANSLTPLVTLSGPNALVPVGPGRYADPTGGTYSIPGVAPGQPAILQVRAWRGNAATYSDAVYGVEVFYHYDGSSYVDPTKLTFTNPTGGVTPASLDGMPGMFNVLLPEPSAMALMVVGLAVLMLFRRRSSRLLAVEARTSVTR